MHVCVGSPKSTKVKVTKSNPQCMHVVLDVSQATKCLKTKHRSRSRSRSKQRNVEVGRRRSLSVASVGVGVGVGVGVTA